MCLLSHVLTISRSSCAVGYLRLGSRKKSILGFGARFDYFLIIVDAANWFTRDGLQWLQLREFIVVPRTRTYPRERGSLRVRDNICLVLERVSANHAREMRSNIARWTVGNGLLTDKCCSNGDYRRLVDYISYCCFRYNNFLWFVIRRSNRFIWIFLYFWGYVVISRWQMKTCWFNLRSFYIINARLYILNLNLFQKLNYLLSRFLIFSTKKYRKTFY